MSLQQTTKLMFWILSIGSSSAAVQFTPLKIDNFPCKPEILKYARHYTCSEDGSVICNHGWKEESPPDFLNPCQVAICDKCEHGECREPNTCFCDMGWEGNGCDVCVPMTGCDKDHGFCVDAYECRCNDGWTGYMCDEPICKNCHNGKCTAPENCSCDVGWFGDNCESCYALSGCQHGSCVDFPDTCKCHTSWSGTLCDTPICLAGCLHGVCVEGKEGADHTCLCEPGWQGIACDQCIPYWECPIQDSTACVNANECICPDGFEGDVKGHCNRNL